MIILVILIQRPEVLLIEIQNWNFNSLCDVNQNGV